MIHAQSCSPSTQDPTLLCPVTVFSIPLVVQLHSPSLSNSIHPHSPLKDTPCAPKSPGPVITIQGFADLWAPRPGLFGFLQTLIENPLELFRQSHIVIVDSLFWPHCGLVIPLQSYSSFLHSKKRRVWYGFQFNRGLDLTQINLHSSSNKF